MTGISKSFGALKAVNELNLSLEPGEIRRLLGPNGSGKSTTMKIIMGMIKPDSGSINVCGVDVGSKPVEARMHIGYVPETPFLCEYLSASEYLDLVGVAYGLDLLPLLTISIALGSVLILLSYIFCKRRVKNLLSNA